MLQVPYFNAPMFLQNKTQIGKIEEIFGAINDGVCSFHPIMLVTCVTSWTWKVLSCCNHANPLHGHPGHTLKLLISTAAVTSSAKFGCLPRSLQHQYWR